MQKFKIFYSWQSDLPSNKTRNFIRECIDEAIDLAEETEAIEAERDEATKGTTGSPNIVTTLFSKIDNCDLFVADISLCFTEDTSKVKRSPNPNVLLELGYAVKALGWERVICLCNTDYGNEYPFDIEHNRITTFSLEGKTKEKVRYELSKIIFINIRDLRKLPPRGKEGMAAHIIGTYDFKTKSVTETLLPMEISESEGFILHNKEILTEAKQLFAEIQELTDRMNKQPEVPIDSSSQEMEESINAIDFSTMNPKLYQALTQAKKNSEKPIVWKNIADDQGRIKHWIGHDVTENFFDVGNLKETIPLLSLDRSSELNGTDDEKEKYKKLQLLSYDLLQLDVRANYLNTFNGMYYFPLAIQNTSTVQDSNIRITISVDVGEIVEPHEHLIWEEYEGLQGHLCRNDDDKDVGIICELFCPNEDSVIHIEEEPYDPANYIPKIPVLGSFGLEPPQKTKEDYAEELEEFIASTAGRDYYEFSIANMRPGECKWLTHGILVKPVDGKIRITYHIFSAHTDGNISRTLEKLFEE